MKDIDIDKLEKMIDLVIKKELVQLQVGDILITPSSLPKTDDTAHEESEELEVDTNEGSPALLAARLAGPRGSPRAVS